MMPKINTDLLNQIIFLGVAEKVKHEERTYPDGHVDIFQLTKQSYHIVFPTNISNYEWVFLISNQIKEEKFKVKILSPKKKEWYAFEGARVEKPNKKQISSDSNIGAWFIGSDNPDRIIESPGEYRVGLELDKKFHQIGSVFFNYQRFPPFTAEQIDAIKSNPYFRNAIQVKLHCNLCDDNIFIYTSLDRISELEKKGYIWQHDLHEDSRVCSCGKATWNLKYIRESMHGMLLHEALPYPGGMSYQRNYAHSEIMKIIIDFNQLVENEKNEAPIQKFIEKYTVLLSKYVARKILFKRKIIGKYETDIVILDINKTLLLIELERASLRLFKKDGHPTAELMHAYGQVNDWLLEYSKHPNAVLAVLGLRPDEVASVRGVVIAGRSKNEKTDHLNRHLSHPPYPAIDFLTLDELGKSLAQLSRELA